MNLRALGSDAVGQGDDADAVATPATRNTARPREHASAMDFPLSPSALERLEGLAPRGAWPGVRESLPAHRKSRGPA